MQSPILAAATPADAKRFASRLKAIVHSCMSNARVALTGSGMVTLLNCVRDLPTNAFSMWDVMRRVQLGLTPSDAAALAMATQLVAFRASSWPADVAAKVTPLLIMRWLKSSSPQSFTSARPALVAYFADMMGGAAVGTADENVLRVQSSLVNKLFMEAAVDVAFALAQLPHYLRLQLTRLAHGSLSDVAFIECCPPGMVGGTFRELTLLLCESPMTGSPLNLLPPYGALLAALMSDDGSLLVRWTGQWELDARLHDRLKFFAEHRKLLTSQFDLARRISDSVLRSFAFNGIGVRTTAGGSRPPATLAELDSTPAFAAILYFLSSQEAVSKQSTTALSPAHVRFMSLLEAERSAIILGASDEEKSKSAAGRYLATVGLEVLVWLRIVEAHAYLPKTPLMHAGLSAAIVDQAVAAAVGELTAIGMPFKLNADGVPSLSSVVL